jgi:hypothetical protein
MLAVLIALLTTDPSPTPKPPVRDDQRGGLAELSAPSGAVTLEARASKGGETGRVSLAVSEGQTVETGRDDGALISRRSS